MKSDVAPYRCVGCGKPAPDRIKECDCPSGLLHNAGGDIVHRRLTVFDLKQELYSVLSQYIDDFSPSQMSAALREIADEEDKRVT